MESIPSQASAVPDQAPAAVSPPGWAEVMVADVRELAASDPHGANVIWNMVRHRLAAKRGKFTPPPSITA